MMGRLLGLDALRGMAALLVALMHADYVFGHEGIFAPAGVMVDFFFMLSGYVMARTYEAKLGAGIDPMQFLTLRFRRLWAPMAIGTTIGCLLHLAVGTNFPVAVTLLAFGLLMLPNLLFLAEPFPFNPPQWSVTYELVGNLLHAALLRRLGFRQLACVPLLCALFLLVWPYMDMRDTPLSLLHAVPRLLLPYTIGIMLWRGLGDRPRLPLWVAFVALPLTLPIITLCLPFIGHHTLTLLILVVMPIVVVAGLTPITGYVAGRIAATAGALSFPLYAVHSPILKAVHQAGGTEWQGLALSLAAALLISAGIERRLISARRSRPTGDLKATSRRGTEGRAQAE